MILTMKCESCGEVLLFGRIRCQYCGEPVDPSYAVKSTVVWTIVNRAIAVANTIQTNSLAMLVLIPSAILCYLMDWKIMFAAFVLLPSVGGSVPVIRWAYTYGDIPWPEPEFIEAQKKIKLHLNCWLTYVAIQTLVLFIW
jgi:hypothetical protein